MHYAKIYQIYFLEGLKQLYILPLLLQIFLHNDNTLHFFYFRNILSLLEYKLYLKTYPRDLSIDSLILLTSIISVPQKVFILPPIFLNIFYNNLNKPIKLITFNIKDTTSAIAITLLILALLSTFNSLYSTSYLFLI